MKPFLTACLLLSSSLVLGLDWGLNVNQVPLAMAGQTSLYVDSMKAKLWLSQPVFGADLRVEGEGAFSAASTGGAWVLSDPSIDLVEASLKGTTPLKGEVAGVLEWDVGRRNVSDLTGGFVLGSRWDGAGISFLSEKIKINGSLGYSGLLLKKTSKVSGSLADATDLTNPAVKSAPQRLYALGGWSSNELFWRQDFQTEALVNLDLRSGRDAVHGLYGTLALTGPLPAGWRQKVTTTAAFRMTPSTSSWAYVATGELSATIPYLGSRLVLNGAAAQGFGGAGFQPVSGKALGEVTSVSTSYGASLGADFSLKPLAKTTVGVKGASLFRLTSEPIALAGLKTDSTDFWLGMEAGVYASWTPTSETSFGLNGGVFVPHAGAFVAGTLPTYLAVVTATLKL